MKLFKKIIFIFIIIFFTSSYAQDVSINVLNQPSSVTQGSTIGRVTIDICNNDGGAVNVPLNKIRPMISLPSSLVGATIVPISNTGWTVISNVGSTIRFENTATIVPGDCSQIVIGYTGLNVGGPLTVIGTIGFNGPQTVGNLTGNDNSTTSITVVGCAVAVPTVASIEQPTCAVSTGSITFTTQTGVLYSIGSGYQSSPVFAGLASGTYTLSVRNALDGTCVTNAASPVVINAVPTAPSVPTVASTIQPSCAVATGTITFTTQAGVLYGLNGTYQASPVFSGLASGSYTLSVKKSSDASCITNGLSKVTIKSIPSFPTAPAVASTVQPSCGVPTGTITFVFQSGVDYGVNGVYQTSSVFAGLTSGTYTLSVRNTLDVTCITTAISTVTITTIPLAPAAPLVDTVKQPTCSDSTGTIIFVAQSGVMYGVNGVYQVSPTFNGLSSGTYTLSVRNISDATCITIASATVTINSVPTPPTVPTVASVVQPTCGVTTGTITFAPQTGVLYGVNGAYQVSPVFSGLTSGSYTLSVRNSNDAICITNASSQVVINAVPSAPSVPTVASTIQPSCGVPIGTINFASQSGVDYGVNGVYQTSPVFAGLASGTYILSVRNTLDVSCITTASTTVTISAVPTAPTAPTVASVVQPTCGVPTGTIVFSPHSGVQYGVNGVYYASTIVFGLVSGTYTLSVRNVLDNTCIATAAATVTINAVPSAPTVPTIASTIQPTCGVLTGTITFASQSNVMYGVNGAYQASPVFSGLSSGTYTLSVKNSSDASCVTNALSDVTINSVPSAPVAPAVASIIQPSCGVLTGTITFATQSGVDYGLNGTYQATPIFSGLSSGTYTLSVRNTNDITCITTASTTVKINDGICAVADTTLATIIPGGTTTSVFSNDTLNDVSGSVTSSNVVVSLVNAPSGFSIAPNGAITVAANTAVGTYSINYQICQLAPNGSNCSTATATVVVDVDHDNDGIADSADADVDGDGILNTAENNSGCGTTVSLTGSDTDCDGDGILNYLDLDSDNDGVNDVVEAGGVDTDGNGMADGSVNSNGIATSAGTGLIPTNTDGTDGANPYDLDSNDDGQSDLSTNGLNPALDTNGDGIVDCASACDVDGDGILAPVDALPLAFGDAKRPDLTPTTDIDSLDFATAGDQKDFVINVFEINNVTNVSGSSISYRVAKLSAFNITYSATSGVSNVFGGTNNSNSDWIFTENSNFITITAKPGITIPQNGSKSIGFKATRKVGIPSNTSQSITVTIVNGSGGEDKVNNNIVETKISAN